MKHKILIILVTVFFSCPSLFLFAQNIDKDRYVKKGDKLLIKLNSNAKYQQSLYYYFKAYESYPTNARLNMKIADCYYNLYYDDLAAKYGTIAYQQNASVAPKATYYKGLDHLIKFEFQDALRYFNEYALMKISPAEKTEVAKRIAQTERIEAMKMNRVSCFIDNLGAEVNTAFNDYAPVYSNPDKRLYYTSKKFGKKERLGNDGGYSEQSFIAKISDEIPYHSTKDKSTLSKKFDAIQCVSWDGTKAIVYTEKKAGDLGEAQIKDGIIKKVKMFPTTVNSPFSHESTACYSPSGDTVFYASNRTGKGVENYGGHDLYYIYRTNKGGKGGWSLPKNLGKQINTNTDDMYVSLSPDGNTLYFSSLGHESLGGFDVYKCEKENGIFGAPQNIGFPINTPCDEIGYTPTLEKNIAYYASTRNEGLGGLDIYKISYFEAKEYSYPPAISIPEEFAYYPIEKLYVDDRTTTILGVVLDSETKEPLYAALELFSLDTQELLSTFETDPATGSYEMSLPSGLNYAINVKNTGYLFQSMNFNIPGNADKATLEQTILLDKIAVNKTIVLKNIFFDTGKATLRPESEVEINTLYELLVENPEIIIEISGHTDNVGNAATNKKLSLARAKAVSDNLIKKGIDTQRLKCEGYGPDKPIASNSTANGRQENRRTEFKVLRADE